ncbi:hypothetical protein [Aminobacter sp. HY435]|uniref:hypothetical protein n=1 Tax=Aminobacter sp. HY435 TaxID=2970917 RepID=UPI0022B967B4|nr:hypothetical protein [Aminobacter sp. HY435]
MISLSNGLLAKRTCAWEHGTERTSRGFGSIHEACTFSEMTPEPLCRQFVLLLVLDVLLVDVLVLVDELVPVLPCESVSLEQDPFEQLLERDLELLVDFDTVTDLLPTRMGPAASVARSAGVNGSCAASTVVRPAAAPNTIAAMAISPRRAMARAPNLPPHGRQPSGI